MSVTWTGPDFPEGVYRIEQSPEGWLQIDDVGHRMRNRWLFNSLEEARNVAEAIRLYYDAHRPATPKSNGGNQ